MRIGEKPVIAAPCAREGVARGEGEIELYDAARWSK